MNYYYEIDSEYFGINFPLGIEAKDLTAELKDANNQILKTEQPSIFRIS